MQYRDVPDHMCGKISFDLLSDPVITPSGITYPYYVNGLVVETGTLVWKWFFVERVVLYRESGPW